jgi:ribosome modulation factor
MPSFSLPSYPPGHPKNEDTAFEAQRQRLDDAFMEGQLAGRNGHRSEMNPHAPGSKEWHEWNRGYRQALALAIAVELRARARRPCNPCVCGGVGRCLDAA